MQCMFLVLHFDNQIVTNIVVLKIRNKWFSVNIFEYYFLKFSKIVPKLIYGVKNVTQGH